MTEFLDETIRLRCNEIGGYWVKVTPKMAPSAYQIWACRIPADVVELAANVVKEKRKSDSQAKACDYFHGEHNYFNLKGKDKEYPSTDLKRLGLPDGTESFTVCDIPYDDRLNELYPLKYSIAFQALKKFSHPPKEKIYDNYYPEQPNRLLLPETKDGLHYHINYEGSQERLYKKIKELISKVWQVEYEIYKLKHNEYDEEFTITDEEKEIFYARLRPSWSNAVPRIKIRKVDDEFDSAIYKAVDETKTSGQKVGLYDEDEYVEQLIFKKEKHDRELARWDKKKKREFLGRH